jgi:signal transduction histidine kinase
VALAAYRILQEALNNAARHAGAGEVQVTLALRADRLTLTVTDDGGGFDPEARGGRGLVGMSERAAAFGGSLSIQSRPGQGTTVTAEIPLQRGDPA